MKIKSIHINFSFLFASLAVNQIENFIMTLMFVKYINLFTGM
jgi:hypothetical protein